MVSDICAFSFLFSFFFFQPALKLKGFSVVSTGIRFTTLPDATPPSAQAITPSNSPPAPAYRSPPTTITALFNPMLGYISGAYTAKVGRDLVLSSRFDFNVYSFESEWVMGAEWWLRRPPRVSEDINDTSPDSAQKTPSPLTEVNSVVKARASTNNVKGVLNVIFFEADFHHLRMYLSCGKVDYEICLSAWALFLTPQANLNSSRPSDWKSRISAQNKRHTITTILFCAQKHRVTLQNSIFNVGHRKESRDYQ